MKKTDIGSLGDDAEEEDRRVARLVASWNSGPAMDLGTSCVIEHISVCLCHCCQQQATRCCLKLLSWSFSLLCSDKQKETALQAMEGSHSTWSWGACAGGSTGEALGSGAQAADTCAACCLFLSLHSVRNGPLFPDCTGKFTFMKVHFLASTFHLKAEAKLETDPVTLSKSPVKPTGVEAQERN